MNVLRVLSRHGDDRFEWSADAVRTHDPEAVAAVAEAERIFREERARGAVALRLAPGRPAVWLVEAGPAILAGSSPQLIGKATRILSDLRVQVRVNAAIAAATEDGFRLTGGQLVQGGVFV